jgi:uncharacterized membrane protein YoaK (UPF0700 family)
MFLLNRIDQFSRAMTFKWFLMAFVAGNVNAGGYLACHRFVTHVTGFATLFGIDVARGAYADAFGILSVPLFFLLGAAVGGFFTDAAIARGGRARYGIVMGSVSGLLVLAAIFGYFQLFGMFGTVFRLEQDYILLVILCAASGLMNAAITTASSSTMRATHLTGISTDLGIGIVRALFGHSDPQMQKREHKRNWMRAGIIASYGAGGVVAAMLFLRVQYLGFLLPAAVAAYVGNLGVRAVSGGAESKANAA